MARLDFTLMSHEQLCMICVKQRREIAKHERTRAELKKKLDAKQVIIDHLSSKERKTMFDALRSAAGMTGELMTCSKVLPGKSKT